KIHVDYEIEGTKMIRAGNGEAGFEFTGTRSAATHVEWAPVEVKWTVTPAMFDALKDGMTLDEVRVILKLSILTYRHPGPEPRFVLVCLDTGDGRDLREFADAYFDKREIESLDQQKSLSQSRLPSRDRSATRSIAGANESPPRMPVKGRVILTFE